MPNKSAYPAAYREASRLQYYGTLFNSIEINSSFKKTPQVRTIERWCTEVPPHFRFTFKLPAAITHVPGLRYDEAELRHFMSILHSAGDKTGCLLAQFPGKVTADLLPQVEELLAAVRNADLSARWQLAVEFRHSSWSTPDVASGLRRHGATQVIHDLPSYPGGGFDAESVYLRFHGTEKGYRGSYDNEYLDQQAHLVKEWLRTGKLVFAYFNNTLGGAALNAQYLLDRVRRVS